MPTKPHSDLIKHKHQCEACQAFALWLATTWLRKVYTFIKDHQMFTIHVYLTFIWINWHTKDILNYIKRNYCIIINVNTLSF